MSADENGELPAGWATATVGDVSQTIQYGHTASAIQSAKGPRFLRIGPYDPAIEDIEAEAVEAGYCTLAETPKGGEKVAIRYSPGPKIDEACRKAEAEFGPRRREVDTFLDFVFGASRDDVELFGTVYAVWNDLLLDDRPATDADIVAGVHAWHPSKHEKFTTARITAEIVRIRERGYTPTGTLPHTHPLPGSAR